MTANHLEVLVEEPSMEAFLNELLPRVLPEGKTFLVHPFQGKPDLLAKLADRLRSYASWLPDDWCILIVVDRDDDDCRRLKKRLEADAEAVGLMTRTRSKGRGWQVANRIAIEELEAWYFGDWESVRALYPRLPSTVVRKDGFRDPDAIAGGTWEAFERVLERYGYFKGGLRKIEAARAIGAVLDPPRCASRSFAVFRAAVLEATT